jgi:hypothetical protein
MFLFGGMQEVIINQFIPKNNQAMKTKFIYILFILFLLTTYSCNMFFDNDTTNEISELSIKPVVKLLGDPIISIPVGGNYTEEGIEAYVGDKLVDYSIVSGNVNPNQEGFYVVTYSAKNQYGWTSYAYRAVLVYSGEPYGSDIDGNYKVGFLFYTTISKYPIDGYWQMENVWAEENVDFPIIFADNGDDTYTIIPGEHPEKGRYTGYGEKNGNNVVFHLLVVSPEGDETRKNFTWSKY